MGTTILAIASALVLCAANNAFNTVFAARTGVILDMGLIACACAGCFLRPSFIFTAGIFYSVFSSFYGSPLFLTAFLYMMMCFVTVNYTQSFYVKHFFSRLMLLLFNSAVSFTFSKLMFESFKDVPLILFAAANSAAGLCVLYAIDMAAGRSKAARQRPSKTIDCLRWGKM